MYGGAAAVRGSTSVSTGLGVRRACAPRCTLTRLPLPPSRCATVQQAPIPAVLTASTCPVVEFLRQG